MKTLTAKPANNSIPPLDGQVHLQTMALKRNLTELSINNVGPRILIVMGSSKQKVAYILTPGGDEIISDADMDRMELALREPSSHMDTLFGHKGTIALVKSTKEKLSAEVGVRHTPQMHDAERSLDLLFHTHGIHIHTDGVLQDRARELGKTVTEEHKKSIHIWDEVTVKLLRTPEGRRIFRQIRPIYLDRQRKREEAELQEFRSMDALFQRLLVKIRPTNIFIGTTAQTGRLEIYARHIVKIAADTNRKLAKPVHNISTEGVSLDMRTYMPISTDFQV